MKRAIIIAFAIVAAIVFALAFKELYVAKDQGYDFTKEGPKPQVCSQEAKICPDGTSVGRSGPNCEFAACPDVSKPAPAADLTGGAELDMGVGDASPMSADGKACVGQGGTWDPQYKECVGVRPAQCEAIGGEYNECASACRHNPDAEACTLQCVQVCQL